MNLDIARMEVRWILEWEGPNYLVLSYIHGKDKRDLDTQDVISFEGEHGLWLAEQFNSTSC